MDFRQAFAKKAYDNLRRKLNQFVLDNKAIMPIKSRLVSY